MGRIGTVESDSCTLDADSELCTATQLRPKNHRNCSLKAAIIDDGKEPGILSRYPDYEMP